MKRIRVASWIVAAALLAGCERAPPAMLGTLEWDLVRLPAPASERIVEIGVREGDLLQPGQPVARLDPRRAEAARAAAEGRVRQAEASLDELISGPRDEQIRAARAREARAASVAANAASERRRVVDLVGRGLLPAAERDRVVAADQAAQAEQRAAAAELAELVAGSRREVLTRAEAALASARAELDAAQLQLDELTVVAPRAGRVDSLPFEVGDRPPAGAALATLEVGDAPYARIYVPESRRVGLEPGAALSVRVDGVAAPLTGRLRTIAREPSFTPYYALAGDDVDRLVYLAEVELGADAAQLPAGLPVRVEPAAAPSAP